MSRALRKAVEHSKQKKETSIHLPDEGISALEDVPELCKTILVTDKIDSFIAVCWVEAQVKYDISFR